MCVGGDQCQRSMSPKVNFILKVLSMFTLKLRLVSDIIWVLLIMYFVFHGLITHLPNNKKML